MINTNLSPDQMLDICGFVTEHKKTFQENKLNLGAMALFCNTHFDFEVKKHDIVFLCEAVKILLDQRNQPVMHVAKKIIHDLQGQIQELKNES